VLEVAIAGDWKEWVMRASFLISFASDLTCFLLISSSLFHTLKASALQEHTRNCY
jgi:hypothetical protein